ncbi:MAG: AI-2E family transporter [Sphingobacteriales bacterium]|nr:AI-2E family transporter [Sphingobacteriales bacterium]
MPLLLKISASFIVVQFIDNWLVQPYIFSNSVEAHPLEIFIVILVAGTLGGVGGMVLAIPVYTILRVVGMEFLSQNKIVQSLTQNIEHVEQEPASKIPSSKKQ